jgi:hypothetical protein
MLHGLYWLCANLASGPPLHIVVDDAHRPDAPSLRHLAFLLPRLEELPVALAVATRLYVPADGRGLLEAITGPGRRRHPGSGSSAEVRPSDGAHWDLRGSFDGTGARGFAPQAGCSGPLSGENERVAEHLLASEPAADA